MYRSAGFRESVAIEFSNGFAFFVNEQADDSLDGKSIPPDTNKALKLKDLSKLHSIDPYDPASDAFRELELDTIGEFRKFLFHGFLRKIIPLEIKVYFSRR
jgi:hypothetical protein